MSSINVFGDRAVLVTCDDRTERLQVSDRLTTALPSASVRIGRLSVLVVVDRPTADLEPSVRSALDSPLLARGDGDRPGRLVTVDVEYDGADLAEAAARLGLSVPGLVAAHVTQLWVVDVMGFAPGFGYLIPEGEATAAWSLVSRRATPRERVPAGAVAIAAGMSAVYPTAMPGGWNLLGRTSARMFDTANPESPSVLTPGTRVQFVAVST